MMQVSDYISLVTAAQKLEIAMGKPIRLVLTSQALPLSQKQ